MGVKRVTPPTTVSCAPRSMAFGSKFDMVRRRGAQERLQWASEMDQFAEAATLSLGNCFRSHKSSLRHLDNARVPQERFN